MHPRHAPYYIRRVRISATDGLFKMLRDQGVPYHPEVGQSRENASTYVLEFPVKAPQNSIYKNDISAIDQLEHWKIVKMNFTEHNPSVTVSVSEDEWIEVANWVYKTGTLLVVCHSYLVITTYINLRRMKRSMKRSTTNLRASCTH